MALDARIVLTLDIGGSGVKASAYDARWPRTIASVVVRYPDDPGAEPGTFSPDLWWSSALQGCRALTDLTGVAEGEYLGITVSAIRIPFVLIDRTTMSSCPACSTGTGGPQTRCAS